MRRRLSISLLTLALHVGSFSVQAEPIRIAVSGRVPNLGNPYASIMTHGLHPSSIMFDALTKLDQNGALVPVLATAWEATEPTRWVFHLRNDVVFANGERFNAHTVVAIFDYLALPEARGMFMAAEARNIEKTRALNDYTVEFITRKPDAILPKRLTLFFMVPPKAWADMGPEEFALHPIGSGTYQLRDWGFQSGQYVLDYNPSSWRAKNSPGAAEALIFYVAADAVARSQSLISGQTHMVFNLGLDMLADLEALGYATFTLESPHIAALAMPNTDPDHPLADVRVRRALNMAIDRQAMSDHILYGTTKPNSQGALPQTFGYNPDIPLYPYDPDRARDLLTEAGHPNGLFLVANISAQAAAPEDVQVYQKVAQDLARIGVTLELRSLQATQWISQWFTGEWDGADILSMNWSSAFYLDAIRSIENASCLKLVRFFCAPEMVPKIEASNRMFDPAERERALQDILLELHELSPTIMLFPQVFTFAYDPRLGPLQFDGEMLMLDALVLGENGKS